MSTKKDNIMENSYNPGSAFTQTSKFGNRILGGKTEWHPGIDFAAPEGTPIPAASGGTVVYSGYNGTLNKLSYGNVVVIKSIGKNGSPYYTLYAHQNGIDMPKVGETVQQGQIIGQVGSTGKSSGAHLHYEILNENAPISNAPGGPLGIKA